MFSCGAGVAGFRTGGTGGGGGAPTGPAGGDLGGTYPNPLVVAAEETSGPQRLTFGSIPDQSLVSRVGTALVAAALGAGLAFAAGTLTLSDVSNLAHGVVPAITAANAVPLSNGGGTAAVWTALSGGGSPVGSGRLINTTAPLAGGGDLSADRTLSVATVSNASAGVVPAITAATAGLTSNGAGTAATWVALSGGGSPVGSGRLISTTSPLTGGGDLSADRTLAVNVVSNTTSGVAPAITGATAALTSNGGGTAATWVSISGGGSPVGTSRTISTTAPLAGGGDLSANRTLSVATLSNTTSGVVPQTNGTAGQALIATATGSTWATDFQAQTLVTTGAIQINSTTPVFRQGLASGSGNGSAAATGAFRVHNDAGAVVTWSMKGRNNADSADIQILGYSTNPNVVIAIGDSNVVSLSVNATTMSLIGTGSLLIGLTSGVRMSGPVLNFNDTVVAPQFGQLITANATAEALQISAQSSSHVTGTGGLLILTSGSGATANGAISIRLGAAVFAAYSTSGGANYQANNLTTTGDLVLGATPSATGDFRVNHTFTQKGRNQANSADFGLLDWGATTNNIFILGDRGATLPNIVLNMATPRIELGFATTIDVRMTIGVLDIKPTVAAYSVTYGGSSLIGLAGAGSVRNIAFYTAAPNFQSGDRILYLTDRTAAPSGNPTGGSFQWSETGGLPAWRTVAGNIVVFTSTSAAGATAGGGAAAPATVSEFLTINFNGNVRKIALYAN